MNIPPKLFLCLLLGVSLGSQAQNSEFRGTVKDKKTQAIIAHAQLVLKTIGEDKIIAFTQSGLDGQFEITKELPLDNLLLEVSSIGYSQQSLELKNQTLPLIIYLEESPIALREVVVKAPKIRAQGDTISYHVASFSSAHDRSIADVLKKMPGIEIAENGEIKYQGENLNKFYIEGGDMLGGRYELATNNIRHEDVATIEILENHQPIKALEELVFSTQPALNIKLREKAKGRWAGSVMAKGGTPSLWGAEALAMRFKRKTQSLNTYKGNKLGEGYTDFNKFLSIGDFARMEGNQVPSYIQVQPSFVGNIPRARYRFNQIQTLSSNHLFNLQKGYSLATEILASRDKQTFNNNSSTTIFLEGSKDIEELKIEQAKQTKKTLEGKAEFKGNKNKFYLKNNLDFKLAWDDELVNTNGTFPNRQAAELDNKQLANDLDILFRFGQKTWSLRTKNEYTENTEDLLVHKDQELLQQLIKQRTFTSNTSTSYSIALAAKLRATFQARFLYSNRVLKNEQAKKQSEGRIKKTHLNLSPNFSYTDAAFYTKLTLNTFYQNLTYNDSSKNYYVVSPSLYAKWTASPKLELNMNLGINTLLPQEETFFEGTILNNYRNKTEGYINLDKGKTYRANLGLKYKNVLALLFANANLMASRVENKVGYTQTFTDEYIINSYIPFDSWANTYAASANVSKWVDALNGSFKFAAGYQVRKSELVREQLTTPYTNHIVSLSALVDSKPSKFLELNYQANFSNNRLYMDDKRKSSFNNFSQSVEFRSAPYKSLQLKASCSHYCNELSPGHYKNFVLADLQASYLTSAKLELMLNVHNIFNQKHYAYSIESSQSTIHQEYKIRPFNLLVGLRYQL